MESTFQQIAELRREYISQPFNEDQVADDPILQFQNWFDEVIKSEQPDPDAMTLSTAVDGRVAARIVLLKGCDERGFVFFTNYESRKSREMMINPRVALTFYWHALHRQVRIEGEETLVQLAWETVFAKRTPSRAICAMKGAVDRVWPYTSRWSRRNVSAWMRMTPRGRPAAAGACARMTGAPQKPTTPASLDSTESEMETRRPAAAERSSGNASQR